MNTIEAAALQAIRFYYHGRGHAAHHRDGVWECEGCRKARTFAGLIGVDLDKGDEA